MYSFSVFLALSSPWLSISSTNGQPMRRLMSQHTEDRSRRKKLKDNRTSSRVYLTIKLTRNISNGNKWTPMIMCPSTATKVSIKTVRRFTTAWVNLNAEMPTNRKSTKMSKMPIKRPQSGDKKLLTQQEKRLKKQVKRLANMHWIKQ